MAFTAEPVAPWMAVDLGGDLVSRLRGLGGQALDLEATTATPPRSLAKARRRPRWR